MFKPKRPFYISRCGVSFRWSFGVGRFKKIISNRWCKAYYTCFPETDEEHQQIYNIFWRFIGAA